MNIGELARSAEVNIDTIRFYERRGVLPRPDRRPSGYRVYTTATVERLRLARALQSLGFTLDEIVGAFHASDSGAATCETERWRLEVVLERLDAKISDLRRTRRELGKALAECAAGRCRFAGPKLLSSRQPGPLANIPHEEMLQGTDGPIAQKRPQA